MVIAILMRDVPEFRGSNVAVGISLGMVEVVADIPVTAVGYSILSPTTMRLTWRPAGSPARGGPAG